MEKDTELKKIETKEKSKVTLCISCGRPAQYNGYCSICNKDTNNETEELLSQTD